jgi:hypothetical protein
MFVQHPGPGLRALSDCDGRLPSDRTGVGLATTKRAHVIDRGFGRRHRIDGAHIGFGRRLRPATRQQGQDDGEPEGHSQEEAHERAFKSLRTVIRGTERTLAGTFEPPVGAHPLFLPVFDANEFRFFRKFELSVIRPFAKQAIPVVMRTVGSAA